METARRRPVEKAFIAQIWFIRQAALTESLVYDMERSQ